MDIVTLMTQNTKMKSSVDIHVADFVQSSEIVDLRGTFKKNQDTVLSSLNHL